jgi:hypothetical protein
LSADFSRLIGFLIATAGFATFPAPSFAPGLLTTTAAASLNAGGILTFIRCHKLSKFWTILSAHLNLLQPVPH